MFITHTYAFILYDSQDEQPTYDQITNDQPTDEALPIQSEDTQSVGTKSVGAKSVENKSVKIKSEGTQTKKTLDKRRYSPNLGYGNYNGGQSPVSKPFMPKQEDLHKTFA